MKVHELMTREVVTVGLDDTLVHARRLLKQHGISALPVVGERGRLLGIVTTRDLLGYQPDDERVPVRKVMRRRVHTLPPEAGVRQLAAVMGERRIHHVVVVERETVRGIVSAFDLLKILALPDPALTPIPPAHGPPPEAALGLVLLDESPECRWVEEHAQPDEEE